MVPYQAVVMVVMVVASSPKEGEGGWAETVWREGESDSILNY